MESLEARQAISVITANVAELQELADSAVDPIDKAKALTRLIEQQSRLKSLLSA
jgi:pyridoxal/pyridoxine/pyridoxamine kinase